MKNKIVNAIFNFFIIVTGCSSIAMLIVVAYDFFKSKDIIVDVLILFAIYGLFIVLVFIDTKVNIIKPKKLEKKEYGNITLNDFYEGE